MEFTHDTRLAYAATPPAEWYTDPAALEMENRRVFGRTWQLVGRVEQVAGPGQYFTTSIGDEPLVVVRGGDGALRALSNVCRHRAGPVADSSGSRRVFQCAYHGWTYSLDGRLLAAPEFDGVECFDKESVTLPRFSAEEWNGLVFVNLDPGAAPLAEVLEDIPERIGHHWGRGLASRRAARRKDWTINCNWKVYVDNYLEGYHIPIAHPSLNRELDYSGYRTETRRFYSIQHSPIKRDTATRLSASALSDADDSALYFWIFPNLMLNVYPDNYSTNLILPLGPERTQTVFEWYVRDPGRPETQAALDRIIEFSDEIQIEDIRLCETVQRGLRSRTYSTGRYSVRRENGVHHFHSLLAEFLSA